MRALLVAALALVGCEGDLTPREHCEAVALLTYASGWGEVFGRIRTEKVCIVAIKPLER